MVYIVYTDHGIEYGCSRPVAAFSSLELAEKFIAEQGDKEWKIVGMTIDIRC